MDRLKLDQIWYKITNDPQSEYILGSQLIDFIEEMRRLNGSIPITQDQIDSVKNFSLSNPDIKIYKYTIGEFLNNLIGLKLNLSLGSLNDEKQKNSLNTKVNEPFVLNDINVDNIINQNKIEEKQKENELVEDKLHEEIEYYKNKYDVLKKEFEFYKKKQFLNQNISTREVKIDYEFTVNEFKRQIEDQRQIMLNISRNIENRNNDNIYNNHMNESKDSDGTMDNTKKGAEIGKGINTIKNLRQFGQILLVFLIAIVFSLMLSKIVFPSTNDIQLNDINSYERKMNTFDMSFQVDPWWTKSDKLSHLIYKFQDWYNEKTHRNVDNTQSPDNDMNTVYDEVFGIKNIS